MAAVCVEEIRAVLLWHAVSEPYAWPESGTRVVVGRGGIDVVHERGSGIIGIFVVLRRHTWSQRHTCGHRVATCGPRGALGAIHVAAHARGGMHETRERSQRAESDRCVEKYRCILRICASRRAIPRLYMYMRSGGGTRSGEFAARCEKVTVLVVARRRNFDRRG